MTCTAKNAKGEPCRARPMKDTSPPTCRLHTPELAEAVREGARLGGIRRHEPKPPRRPLTPSEIGSRSWVTRERNRRLAAEERRRRLGTAPIGSPGWMRPLSEPAAVDATTRRTESPAPVVEQEPPGERVEVPRPGSKPFSARDAREWLERHGVDPFPRPGGERPRSVESWSPYERDGD